MSDKGAPKLEAADLSGLYKSIAVDRELNRKADKNVKKDFIEARKGATDILIAIQNILAPKRRSGNFWVRFRPAWRLFIQYGHKCVALRMASINKEGGFRGLIPHIHFHALHCELHSCSWPDESELREPMNTIAAPPDGWAIKTERMYLLVARRAHTINKYRAADLFAMHAAPYMRQFQQYSKAEAWTIKCLYEWKRLKGIQQCKNRYHRKIGMCSNCGVTNDSKSGPQKYESDLFLDPRVNAQATVFFERVFGGGKSGELETRGKSKGAVSRVEMWEGEEEEIREGANEYMEEVEAARRERRQRKQAAKEKRVRDERRRMEEARMLKEEQDKREGEGDDRGGGRRRRKSTKRSTLVKAELQELKDLIPGLNDDRTQLEMVEARKKLAEEKLRGHAVQIPKGSRAAVAPTSSYMQHTPLDYVEERMPYLAEWALMELEDTAGYLQHKKDKCTDAAARVLQSIYRDHLLRCRYLLLHTQFLGSKRHSYREMLKHQKQRQARQTARLFAAATIIQAQSRGLCIRHFVQHLLKLARCVNRTTACVDLIATSLRHDGYLYPKVLERLAFHANYIIAEKQAKEDSKAADKAEWTLVVKGRPGNGAKGKLDAVKDRPYGGRHGRAEKVLVPVGLARRILERGGGNHVPWFVAIPQRVKFLQAVLMQKTVQAFCMRVCLAGARRAVQQYVHSLRQEGGMEKFIIEYVCDYDLQDRTGAWYHCGQRGFYSITEIEAHAKWHQDKKEEERNKMKEARIKFKAEINKEQMFFEELAKKRNYTEPKGLEYIMAQNGRGLQDQYRDTSLLVGRGQQVKEIKQGVCVVRKRMMRLGMERRLVADDKGAAEEQQQQQLPAKFQVGSPALAGPKLPSSPQLLLTGALKLNGSAAADATEVAVTMTHEQKRLRDKKAARRKVKEEAFLKALVGKREEVVAKKDQERVRQLLKTPQNIESTESTENTENIQSTRGTRRKGAASKGAEAGAGAAIDWSIGWYGSGDAKGGEDAATAKGRGPDGAGGGKVDFADRPSSKRARTPLLVRWKDEQGGGGRGAVCEDDGLIDGLVLPSLGSKSAPAAIGNAASRKGKGASKVGSLIQMAGSRLPRLGDKNKPKTKGAEAKAKASGRRPFLRLVNARDSSEEVPAAASTLPELIDLLAMARGVPSNQSEGAAAHVGGGGNEVTIGRSSKCDVQLDTRDSCMLSKVHATIELYAQTVVLTDLGSRNGTYLSSQAGSTEAATVRKLKPQETISLAAGDVVLFGSRPSKSRRTNGTEARYELVFG
jgi:hypothetical protein